MVYFQELWARAEAAKRRRGVGHGRSRSARASLGRPRTRSPMMFFWISEEPA